MREDYTVPIFCSELGQLKGVTRFGSGNSSGTARSDVSWHQCPEAVREYLANVDYTGTAYTETAIGDYAPDPAALAAASEPFRTWLSNHTPEKQRAFFVRTAEQLWAKGDEPAEIDHDSFYILIPSFCVGELTKAFQIGFLVYLPFIAIDIIVSNILLAMGMMMVSPVTISLPFKLLLFVMIDGWTLLVQGLIRGYVL